MEYGVTILENLIAKIDAMSITDYEKIFEFEATVLKNSENIDDFIRVILPFAEGYDHLTDQVTDQATDQVTD